MSFQFKPRLEAMEAREVPAALSFRLANGAVGSGLFSPQRAWTLTKFRNHWPSRT